MGQTVTTRDSGDGNKTVIVTTLAGGGLTADADVRRSLPYPDKPSGIAIDTAGNLYVTDLLNHRIHKVTPKGKVSSLAGSEKGFADGIGDAARFSFPIGITIDAAGNLYVADTSNHRIRKITPKGEVSTLAGSEEGFANCVGEAAQFCYPEGIAIDAAGNLYVTDTLNSRIRKITPKGEVSTLAGSEDGFAGGIGGAAQFSYPRGIAIDAAGNLYVADTSNHRIRKVTQKGKVSTLAGSEDGFADGIGDAAQFNYPIGITIDTAGNLYVADTYNHRIRKVTPKGEVSTLAGSEEGFADGIGSAAQFNYPEGIVIDAAGNLYVADNMNDRIRRITPAGEVSTLVGSGSSGYADGTGNAVQFTRPFGVVSDKAGNLYVADSFNNRIRKVTPKGETSTLAGSTRGNADGQGNVAQFNKPFGIAIDTAGNLYVADSSNNRIRKITPKGEVSTLAGSEKGFADGVGEAAQFDFPEGIAIDAAGNLYVTDRYNSRIRKITPKGEVSTLAGSEDGFADGIGSAARFRYPIGISIDTAGNLYVADQNNDRIRKVTPKGEVSTLAGSTRGNADGQGNVAQFNEPFGIAIDTTGNLYVADSSNNRIRKITPKGEVSTLAGSKKGFADGIGSVAKFKSPCGITIDAAGNIYVADTDNHRIRKIVIE